LTGSSLWKPIVKFNIVYVITSDELFNNVYKWFLNLYWRRRVRCSSDITTVICLYNIFINRLIRNLFSERLCTRNKPFSVVKLVFLGPPQRGFRCFRRRRRGRWKKNKLQKIATDGYPPTHLPATRLSCNVITA